MAQIPQVAQAIVDFAPQHPFFVGIDSDGCVRLDGAQAEGSLHPQHDPRLGPAAHLEVRARPRSGSTSAPAGAGPTAGRAGQDVRAAGGAAGGAGRGFTVPEGKAIQAFIDAGYTQSEGGLNPTSPRARG